MNSDLAFHLNATGSQLRMLVFLEYDNRYDWVSGTKFFICMLVVLLIQNPVGQRILSTSHHDRGGTLSKYFGSAGSDIPCEFALTPDSVKELIAITG